MLRRRPWSKALNVSTTASQARAWWLYRMLYSPHPLREKLTLFWHNHFATSNAKVNNAGFMLGQYELMYRHALGNFRDLLQEMSNDPAMLIWLDTNQSKKGMPNENYARELMELFSLGIGHYTEADIREAAKAFTGWEIKDRKAIFDPAQHDDSEKTVLRQKGKWTGADIVRICLDQPAASPFIVGKLYRFLISETTPPTPELIAPLAERFRKSNYDFGDLVQTMLRSNLFFSPDAYRTQVKSPVDFALGIAHCPGRTRRHLGTGSGARRARAERFLPALGEGLGRRPKLAQRPDAALSPEPGPGADLDRRSALRPASRPGRPGSPSTD